MRHIGTAGRGEPVVLLGYQPRDGMVAFIRVGNLTEMEKDTLQSAIIRHHNAKTLLNELFSENSEVTGANAGQYFFNRAETAPMRDVAISDEIQCREWCKGDIARFNAKVPHNEWLEKIKVAINPNNATEAPPITVASPDPAAPPPKDPASRIEQELLKMIDSDVPVVSTPAPQVVKVAADTSQMTAPWAKSPQDMQDRIDALEGLITKLTKKVGELTTSIRTLCRQEKKAGRKDVISPAAGVDETNED